MAEAVAADGAGILRRRELVRLLVLLVARDCERLVLVVLLVLLELDLARARGRSRSRSSVALARGDQLGEHPGERVDLVAAELGAGGGARLRVGEHALEPEHQRVAHLPLRASGRAGPPRSRRARRRARGGAPCRARAPERDPRRREGTAHRPTLPRGPRRRPTGPPPPKESSAAEWLPACAQHVPRAANWRGAPARRVSPGASRATASIARAAAPSTVFRRAPAAQAAEDGERIARARPPRRPRRRARPRRARASRAPPPPPARRRRRSGSGSGA